MRQNNCVSSEIKRFEASKSCWCVFLSVLGFYPRMSAGDLPVFTLEIRADALFTDKKRRADKAASG